MTKLLLFNDKYILEGSRITGFDGNILSSSYLFSHRIMQITEAVVKNCGGRNITAELAGRSFFCPMFTHSSNFPISDFQKDILSLARGARVN